MAFNKIIYDNQTLIDLTADTVDAEHLLTGTTAHNKAGETITGTCDFDSNTQDATVAVAEILEGETAYARGTMLTGTMKNNGAVNGVISSVNESYKIVGGYHDGSGTVAIDEAEKAKLVASNIREGTTILGITGTMSGSESVKAETKTVTPTTAAQVVVPNAEAGYNYISQVTVNAIPYVESANAAGGTTVTIG